MGFCFLEVPKRNGLIYFGILQWFNISFFLFPPSGRVLLGTKDANKGGGNTNDIPFSYLISFYPFFFLGLPKLFF